MLRKSSPLKTDDSCCCFFSFSLFCLMMPNIYHTSEGRGRTKERGEILIYTEGCLLNSSSEKNRNTEQLLSLTVIPMFPKPCQNSGNLSLFFSFLLLLCCFLLCFFLKHSLAGKLRDCKIACELLGLGPYAASLPELASDLNWLTHSTLKERYRCYCSVIIYCKIFILDSFHFVAFWFAVYGPRPVLVENRAQISAGLIDMHCLC